MIVEAGTPRLGTPRSNRTEHTDGRWSPTTRRPAEHTANRMRSEFESTRTKHRIASVTEFTEEGERIIKKIGGQEIAVFYVDGDYHPVANYCAH
jgi:hypothetical protein